MGVVPYRTAYNWQRAAVQRVIDGSSTDLLMVLQHEPVVTLGRMADRDNILVSDTNLADHGIDVIETDRGGDVTYHGPGQLVAYPILDLNLYRKDIGWYLRRLEETVIRLLAEYGIDGERIEGRTGVWVPQGKIAAIGIGIRRWVTYHGLALNVAANMDHFALITACGIRDRPVTSLHMLLKKDIAVEDVIDQFIDRFVEVFEIDRVHQVSETEFTETG